MINGLCNFTEISLSSIEGRVSAKKIPETIRGWNRAPNGWKVKRKEFIELATLVEKLRKK